MAEIVNEKQLPVVRIWLQCLLQKLSGRGSIGRYALIGLTGVFLDIAVFFALTRLGFLPVLSAAVGTLAGISNNYVWNSLLNFRVALAGHKTFKFLFVGIVGMTISSASVYLQILSGVEPDIAKLATIPVIAGAQFVANRRWTFHEEKPNRGQS